MAELEAKVMEVLRQAGEMQVDSPPAHLYLDLAENVVRQAARWQTPQGMIGDPHNAPGGESATATARYCAAVGHLFNAGRCHDLLTTAMSAFDWCCGQMISHYRAGKQWPCSVFNLKDMMILYGALKPLAPLHQLARWTEALREPEPERVYFGERNWAFYGAAAEGLRIYHGLSDRVDYIDRILESELQWWTDFGMYLDPGDPVTYDLTVRQSLALMLEYGYAGRYADWAREALRTGALTTLLFVSPTGVAPYGGRSNQYHMMEGMIAYFAEWQAKQEMRAGNLSLAAALRRMALLAAASVSRWLLRDPYFCQKNQFADQPFFGQDGFAADQNAHSGYGLLAANLFAGAWHVADERIAPGASPADTGGYVLHLPDAFHRIFATAGGYHIQIDTRGQAGYDATGLGRIHRRDAPIDIAMNSSIVPAPHYQMPLPNSPRAVALGVGWPVGDDWRTLAQSGRDTHDVEVCVEREEASGVEFTVSYLDREGALGTARVNEHYTLSGEGLRVACEVPGLSRLRLQAPVIETDGTERSEVALDADGLEVRYLGCVYRLRVPGCIEPPRFEPWLAPNRNGVHRVAIFEVEGPRIEWQAEIV